MTNQLKAVGVLLCGILCLSCSVVRAEQKFAAFNTSESVFEVTPSDATLSLITQSELTSFSLGASTRLGNTLYYVAAPSGSSENALFKVNLKTTALTFVDLDRSGDDDEVRALFIRRGKLYGIFYNGNAGSVGLYRITPATGATTLVLDLSDLDAEPVPGAIAQVLGVPYMIFKLNSDANRRLLVKFGSTVSSIRSKEILDSDQNPISCEKIKFNLPRAKFVCLASAESQTQVKVCKVTLAGRASCSSALSGIERVAGGHTLLTPNQKIYYALVYAPGEPDNQRLIKFTPAGVVKSNQIVNTLLIGAHFANEAPPLLGLP
ncbi:MAG: hypothetical protein K1X83_11900 [Oligoflexia bacterium]|nr:hypothetical protein [Oligoflexia bacterium]